MINSQTKGTPTFSSFEKTHTPSPPNNIGTGCRFMSGMLLRFYAEMCETHVTHHLMDTSNAI